LGALVLSVACASPAANEPANEADTLKQEVEQRIESAVAAGFSGVVLVTVDGQHVVHSGHGLADRERGLENRTDTAFDVGSVMKNLTATAVFALEQAGALSLSATLETIFPDVPADKADITLLELVQHRAGFDEYHDTEGDFEPMTRSEARERIFAQELLFAPGTDEAYSNSGYTLLADVVETVSERAFTEFVRTELLEPAGMDHSGFYTDELWQSVDTAIGYEAETFGENDPASWPYTWALVGNGGLVATAGDLERWSTSLFGGSILDEAALEAIQTDYFATSSAVLGGETVYGYAGAGDFGLGGVGVEAPAAETRVIIVSNSYDVFDVETFALELASFVLEQR
jgi:CubicO group peptidase (beta-lactamase class C family)